MRYLGMDVHVKSVSPAMRRLHQLDTPDERALSRLTRRNSHAQRRQDRVE
jgi:hypothetical protein